jgi:hypothetical protein
MNKKKCITSLLVGMAYTLVFSLVLLMQVPSQAVELRYPVNAYEGEQLAKVRGWEKQWVGKTITPANLDQVKDYMPETLYNLMSDTGTWGEISFEIVPYRPMIPSEGELKYTREYLGQAKIGPDDGILNYTGGYPFPNTRNPLEMMYNFDKRNLGDNLGALQDPFITDGKRKYDRVFTIYTDMIYFTGRREVPPTPSITPNKKKIFRAAHTHYRQPASLKGNRGMNIKWTDTSRSYGSWSWSSATRRIVRRSSAQRQDHVGGTDICMDDNMTWDGVIPSQTYKLLGEKELLIARHQDLEVVFKGHKEGYCLLNGLQKERMKHFVVEAVNKDPNYIYTRQVYYLDPEIWSINYADKWDRSGNLWKTFESAYLIRKNLATGAPTLIQGVSHIIDVQRMHSTGGPVETKLGETDEKHSPSYFTPRALQKHGY